VGAGSLKKKTLGLVAPRLAVGYRGELP